jgi:hypothetical protein
MQAEQRRNQDMDKSHGREIKWKGKALNRGK